MLRKTMMVMAVIVCLGSVGCESFSESKKLAQRRWEKASAGAKLTLAQQEFDENRFDEAKKSVSKCVRADPNNAQAHLLYGKLLLVEDNQADAVRELRLAVELNEELAEGWYWLGLATQGLQQTQQSWWENQQILFYYKKALTLNPSNIDYILAVAEIYTEQKKLEEATRLLEEKIAAMPRQVSLRIAAANLMWRLGKNERAIELCKQAMFMKSDDSSIAEALGYYYVFNGQWSEGAEIFNRLIEQCQDEQKKKLYLQTAALCSVNCAQYNRAINCYNKLSIEERDNAEFWVKMGQAALGADAAEKALICGETALALQPGYADAIVLAGCAQYLMEDYSEAIKNFEKITSGEKNECISWLMRARCYEQLGRKNEAGQAYRKALEIEPHSELGDFLAKGKDIEDLELATRD